MRLPVILHLNQKKKKFCKTPIRRTIQNLEVFFPSQENLTLTVIFALNTAWHPHISNFIMLQTFLESFHSNLNKHLPLFCELHFKIRILQTSTYNGTRQNPKYSSFIVEERNRIKSWHS